MSGWRLEGSGRGQGAKEVRAQLSLKSRQRHIPLSDAGVHSPSVHR